MASIGSAVVSWKSKVLRLTMGRKSIYTPFQELNQPNVAVILFAAPQYIKSCPTHKVLSAPGWELKTSIVSVICSWTEAVTLDPTH